jgi:hypothetical protein
MKAKKTCADCLHCKVSKKSTKESRMCFCSEKKKRTNHIETYWLVKKPCDEFEDMSA